MFRGIKIALLAAMLASPALAQKQVELVSALPVVGSGGQIGIGITQILNTVQKEREYKFAVSMGAAGDVAAMRAIVNAKQNQDTVFYTGISTITANRITNPTANFDRDKDFVISVGIGKNTLGVLVAGDSSIKNIDELAALIKSKPKSYSGGTLTAPAASMMNDVFLKRYGLEGRVEEIKYKSVPEIVLAVQNKEIDYTVFTMPDMIGLKALLVSSDERMKTFPDAPTGKEIGFTEFNLQSILLFAVPKERAGFVKTFEADMKLACAHPDFKKVAELRAPYLSYCMDPKETEATIKNELAFINRIYNPKASN
jgi:tripartite-type tricarboxylate transporter receptor subunit TctC